MFAYCLCYVCLLLISNQVGLCIKGLSRDQAWMSPFQAQGERYEELAVFQFRFFALCFLLRPSPSKKSCSQPAFKEKENCSCPEAL